jgi:hypothetical protein
VNFPSSQIFSDVFQYLRDSVTIIFLILGEPVITSKSLQLCTIRISYYINILLMCHEANRLQILYITIICINCIPYLDADFPLKFLQVLLTLFDIRRNYDKPTCRCHYIYDSNAYILRPVIPYKLVYDKRHDI